MKDEPMIHLHRTLKLLTLLFIFLLPASSNANSFYYWRGTFQLSPAEKDILKRFAVNKLYVRLFDIDVRAGKGAVPVGTLMFKSEKYDELHRVEIVPVIFITIRSIPKESSEHTEQTLNMLAERILSRIDKMMIGFGRADYKELQIDCDWTLSTQKSYFKLLQLLKDKLHKKSRILSVTVRLHQIKYAERTGTPPADRAVLMFYNTGELTSPDTQNSILHLPTAFAYTSKLPEYPLRLAVALPLFAWGVHFRNDRFIGILHECTADMLSLYPKEVQCKASICKVLVEGNYCKTKTLLAGDTIRLETSRADDLKGAVKHLTPLLKQKSNKTEWILYHLDERWVSTYPNSFFDDLFAASNRNSNE